MTTVGHLLIVAPNWLGDAVMALPAIADIVTANPAAAITVAARPSIAPLFTMVPGVREAKVYDTRRSRKPNGNELPWSDYDAALLLPNSFQSALAVWRGGVGQRWGYRTDCRGPLLTRGVAPAPGGLHQAAYYQLLVRSLGFPSGPLEPRLEPSSQARTAGRDLLLAAGWDGRQILVALAPGAAYGGAKRWPAASYAGLADALAGDYIKTVLIGGRDDEAAGREVIGRAKTQVLNLIGRTGLPALAGALVHCRALVSNDSGAMHFGAALGVAVTAVFGPTDEHATRPLRRSGGPAPTVLVHDVWCRPCLLRECPLTHRCMRGMSVSRVAESVGRGLAALP
jgi:heptosyltransferase-2